MADRRETTRSGTQALHGANRDVAEHESTYVERVHSVRKEGVTGPRRHSLGKLEQRLHRTVLLREVPRGTHGPVKTPVVADDDQVRSFHKWGKIRGAFRAWLLHQGCQPDVGHGGEGRRRFGDRHRDDRGVEPFALAHQIGEAREGTRDAMRLGERRGAPGSRTATHAFDRMSGDAAGDRVLRRNRPAADERDPRSRRAHEIGHSRVPASLPGSIGRATVTPSAPAVSAPMHALSASSAVGGGSVSTLPDATSSKSRIIGASPHTLPGASPSKIFSVAGAVRTMRASVVARRTTLTTLESASSMTASRKQTSA